MDSQATQYKKMTETPIPKLVITLGIPTTISMLVTSVYNMADTYFVGADGPSASGAIGVVFGLMSIIQAFGFMFGQGAGALCSRELGAKNTKRASEYASTGFVSAFLCGALITLFGFIFFDPLLTVLGSTPTILEYSRPYATYILIAAPFMCSSCVLNNILRYEGKATFAMIGLTSGGLLNILFDWVLIDKFGMGVTGAGIATAVSQVIGFCILLSMFIRGKTTSKLTLKMICFDPGTELTICKTGFPSLVRQGLASVTTMALNGCIKACCAPDAELIDNAIAAMSIVNRICFFTFATALGIGQGFQPVCAFNYGAKKYDRVVNAFLFTVAVGEVLLGTVAAVGLFCTDFLVSIFQDAPKVIEIGSFALAAQFVGQIFQPAAVCSNMLFQSTGKAAQATLLSMLRNGLFFIPVLLIMSHFEGLLGIQLAQAISDVLTMAVALPMAIAFIKKLRRMQSELPQDSK